ncbi:MAG TPA: transketolase [Solirubrobacteraceae bacterium]|nr:transketolase [Solirubrobacteraceae bacterium]
MTATGEALSLDDLCIDTIRTLSMDAVQKANSGHPGTPMALAPIAYTLFTRTMRHNPHDEHWPDRDRFVLSAGHASMLLYSTLFLSGYDFTLEDLENFRQLHSKTPGHPEYREVPGAEVTTGPLGQGISHAVGFALAERMLAERFNRPGHEVVNHTTYVIASDGDMEEGISSEASSLAGHLGLGKLIVFYDRNHISIEGDTAIALSEDTPLRYAAYDWDVQDIGEDISIARLEEALATAQGVTDKPSLIVMRTHIAFGAPTKQDTAGAHGSPLGDEEILATKRFYNWPSTEPFFVPDEALKHFRTCIERGAAQQREWSERFEHYKADFPELAAEFERITSNKRPPNWDADVPKFDADAKGVATRKSSETVLQWAAKNVPELIGGSADLAPSTLTLIDEADSVDTGRFAGRNLHFGIREHAMGAIVNGLTLHNFRAYGATFLTFSDYMKGAIRLAALMRLPSIFVFTHDSIGLGEDGPTHQPIEQLAHLRATPNVSVIRPGDANETALAWRHAINATDHPIAMILSRQNVPTLDPASVPDDAIERGAYVLQDADDPQVILIGTGSEVQVAVAAAALLDADGTRVRVVSMPCEDHFQNQDQAYRDSVLPPAIRARVSVEAATTFGWHRWVGDLGETIGMEGFGASAPAGALYEYFGITGEAVADAARRSLNRAQSN